jgi:regulator of protease activity HflC (stomatin/prohibitin superfamily)
MKYLLIAFLFLTSCSIVGPGQRGVRIMLGSASDDPKPPGAYLWFPFILGMAKVDVQIQKSQIINLSAASKDMQDVGAVIAVNWSMNPDNVVKTYKEIGNQDDVDDRILIPAVSEVFKAATAKRNAEEILTKRLDMKKDIDDGLKARLDQYGIHLYDVSIVDLSFSAGFTQAIEHKQIAEQQAKQAAYVTEKAIQDAKAEVEIAKGKNEAQKLLQTTTSAAILQKAAIDKWDGHFPQVMGTTTLPFINIGKDK